MGGPKIMNILGLMQSVLYLIMNALLYPVIGLLIILVIVVLFILGNFASEFVFRHKRLPDTDQGSEQLAAQVSKEILLAEFEEASGHIKKHLGQFLGQSRLLRDFLKDFAHQIAKGKENLDIRAEKILHQNEIKVSELLDKTRVMIRIGPMLGLMGTLIPMGPALLALTKGDLTQMANCLIIAFGTTVSGLAVGVLAYVISVARERWYAQDIKDMEYVVDLMMGHIENHDPSVGKEEKQKATVLPMARGEK
jgi:biopolymer transport protein ExbB/TolQ